MKSSQHLTVLLVSLIQLNLPPYAWAQTDSIKNVRVSGRALLANVGFAPIPAFSFNSPIVIGSLSVSKGRFSYEPDVSLGLNGKPWLTNHWLRFDIKNTGKWNLEAGLDAFLYFETQRNAQGEEVIYAQRNMNFELSNSWLLAKNSSLTLTLWHPVGYDPGALSGNVVDLSISFSDLPCGGEFLFKAKPQFFYFNFDGPVDGIYASLTVGVEHAKLPVSIYFQAVQPFWTGFNAAGFQWNTGMVCTF